MMGRMLHLTFSLSHPPAKEWFGDGLLSRVVVRINEVKV